MSNYFEDSFGNKSSGRLNAHIALWAAIIFAIIGFIAIFFKIDITLYCAGVVTTFLSYSAGTKLVQSNIEKNGNSR